MAKRTHNQNTLLFGSQNGLCDECGFQFKQVDLRKRWDGLVVCRDCWEPQHPSDLYDYRSRDNSGGAGSSTRSDDTGTETGTSVGGETIPKALAITPKTFDQQNTGFPYEYQFLFTGAASVTWEVTAGAIPSGLTLDTNTGLMSGTFTTEESASWTLKITSPDGRTDTESFTMEITQGLYELIGNNSNLAYWWRFDDNGDWDNDIAVNYAVNATGVEDSILDPATSGFGDAQVARYIEKSSGPPGVGDSGVFNGATSYLFCNDYTDITDMCGTPTELYWLTTEYVLYLDSLPGEGERYATAAIGPYGVSGSNRGWLQWITETGEFRCVVYGSQQNDFWASVSPVPVGEWVHIVASVAIRPNGKAAHRRIFFNGVDAGWQTYSVNEYASVYGDAPMELRIGCRRVWSGTVNGGNPDMFFAGRMAMAAGYNKWEMDEATILEHYAATGIG